jgi:dihydrofolate reductase
MLGTVLLYGSLIMPGKTYFAPPPPPPQRKVIVVSTSPLINRRHKDVDDFIEFLKDLIKPKSKSKRPKRWQ